MISILWIVMIVLCVLWLLGFGLHIGGALIHVLLVAAILLIWNVFFAYRSPRVP